MPLLAALKVVLITNILQGESNEKLKKAKYQVTAFIFAPGVFELRKILPFQFSHRR